MKRVLAWLALVSLVISIGVSIAWRLLTREEPLDMDPTGIRMEVVNGCGVPRLARAIADRIESEGFVVYGLGNTNEICEHTTVVDLLDPSGACAENVSKAFSVKQRWLGLPTGRKLFPETSVRLDSTRFLEVLLVIGQDYRRFFPDLVVLH